MKNFIKTFAIWLRLLLNFRPRSLFIASYHKQSNHACSIWKRGIGGRMFVSLNRPHDWSLLPCKFEDYSLKPILYWEAAKYFPDVSY